MLTYPSSIESIKHIADNAKYIVAQEHLSIGLSETLFTLAA